MMLIILVAFLLLSGLASQSKEIGALFFGMLGLVLSFGGFVLLFYVGITLKY